MGFGGLILVWGFYLGGPFMLHLQNTGAETTSKGGVRRIWWAGVFSFVFRARAEAPGMNINVNTFIASQTDGWDTAY